MERPGYERFGLVTNPFQDLASETIDEIVLYHVQQEWDESLEAIKQDVLELKRKAAVALVGKMGLGKTQRLRVTAQQAQQVDAYACCVDAVRGPAGIAELAKAMLAARRGRGKG